MAEVLHENLDEIKDYMFVLETGNDRSYAFPIENGYLELRGIREDDWVTITYSGELSEVRAFDGELISVEKIRKVTMTKKQAEFLLASKSVSGNCAWGYLFTRTLRCVWSGWMCLDFNGNCVAILFKKKRIIGDLSWTKMIDVG